MNGVRKTVELVRLAAERIFGSGLPPGIDWVEVLTGFRSLRLVRGEPSGKGLLFGDARAKDPVGLKIVADRAWATEVLGYGQLWRLPVFPWQDHRGRLARVSRESLLFEPVERDGEKAWLVKKSGSWQFSVSVRCMGEEHELLFGPRGVRSSVHTPEGVRLLAELGEPGCGEMLNHWRRGDWLGLDVVNRIFPWRRLGRLVGRPPSHDERWEMALIALVREELLVSGLQASVAVYMGRPGRYVAVDAGGVQVPLGRAGKDSWYGGLLKRGLRARQGFFPLKRREDGSVVCMDGILGITVVHGR